VSFSQGSPTMAALQDRGVWLVVPVNPDGIVPFSLFALYTDGACGSTPYLPLDSNPAPLFRMVQTNPGDSTGYYPGNPTVDQVFAAYSPLGRPDLCQSTAAIGWTGPVLAGPLQTLDLSGFPAPYAAQ
jgi:hypothetical protein